VPVTGRGQGEGPLPAEFRIQTAPIAGHVRGLVERAAAIHPDRTRDTDKLLRLELDLHLLILQRAPESPAG
jgi:hypothetical protein